MSAWGPVRVDGLCDDGDETPDGLKEADSDRIMAGAPSDGIFSGLSPLDLLCNHGAIPFN
jgi:hypothetical protein